MLYNNGLALLLGIGDVRDWTNSNMFECKSYPDVAFHFWRVSGWLTGLTVVRSIKSAWHDSWFYSFLMSSKPDLFKLFWGGVSSTRLGRWMWNKSHLHLNVSDLCLFVAHRTCVVWNCRIVCACVSPRVVSLLSCYLSAPREAGLEACERGSEWLCQPRSPDSASAMCHTYTYTGTHCSRVLMQTSWLSWFNICPDAFTYREVVSKLSEIVKLQRNRKCQRDLRCSWHPAQWTCCAKL